MELRDIQSCLRAGIESRSTEVGPFLVLINSGSDNPFSNYAVPTDGAAPTSAANTPMSSPGISHRSAPSFHDRE